MKNCQRFFAVAAAALSLLFARVPAASAQETLSSIREQGFALFANGDFADALPFFEQMIEIQGSSTDAMVISSMERVYYNAALCRFFTGDFAQAQRSFGRYCDKYKRGTYLHEAFLYVADCLRYQSKYPDAIGQYKAAMARFRYPPEIRSDAYAYIAQCHLAQDQWQEAVSPLRQAFFFAPDGLRRNRAATLLATAYLKTLDLEEVYKIVPYLLTRDSLSSRSVAFNLAALEAGDSLFADERYREAFWVHRLVYPYGDVLEKARAYLDRLVAMEKMNSRYAARPRNIMRIREWIAETELEIENMEKNVPDYDAGLSYRIARGYMEARRFREARELFLHLHETKIPEHTEESLYFAFWCSVQIGEHASTHAIARTYMDEYPRGEWYEILTLTDGQIRAMEKEWRAVIDHFAEVLRVRPEHQSRPECLYLTGYAHFMEEEFEQCRSVLSEIREKFPQSEMAADAVYWSAMASIFGGDFKTGEKDFTEIIEKFPSSRYAVDARFRRAICNYAEASYDLADERLKEFVSSYPNETTASEAVMTRGDIAGALGRPLEAVALYTRAMNVETNGLNIEHYNHCAFRAGQILYEAEDYDSLKAHFNRYIEKNRDGSNIPLAVYWIGRGMRQQGEKYAALKFYKDAAVKFGKDRKSVGVDMILDEWISLASSLSGAEADSAWKGLPYSIRSASDYNDPVSALRLRRMTLYRPGIARGEKERILDLICSATNIPHASPAVLELMLDTAKARGATNLAVRAASAIVSDFPETDYALGARLFLADAALAQIALEPAGSEKREKLFNGAMRNLAEIRDNYATLPEAAEALMKLGAIYADRRDFAAADECYKQVLGVRDWRARWPEALYGRGKCAEKSSEWLKAAAYYERIYLMYGGYRAISAKAYLARAKALQRGYEGNAAKETLMAMLSQEDLAEFPEYGEAGRLLAAWGGAKQ